MDAHEVVPHIMKRDGCFVVLDFLGEPVGQAGEPAHGHPHGEILALDVAGRDELHFGFPDADHLLTAGADRSRIVKRKLLY